MIVIRRALQIVVGLLVLGLLFEMAKTPTAHLVDDAVIIGFLVSIILVLGPWWPSADKTRSMIQLRRLLQIVFGLLVLALLFMMVNSPTTNLGSSLGLIGVCILVILVLGPWWPGPDKAWIWDWALKFDLPTDDPMIAAPFASLAIGIFSLFHAWGHTQPNPQIHRFERLIAPFSSHEGIALAWVLIGVGCFVSAWQAFRRLQGRPKKLS